MTAAVDVDAMRSEETISFDRYGRYLIVPDGGTKPVPHTRVTTFASTLDDRYGLEKWGLRMSALGFRIRPDLYSKLCGTDPDDKPGMDAVCGEAKEAGGATVGANMGTGLHGMTDQVDHGTAPEKFPAQFCNDLVAYQETLAANDVKIIPEYIERYVVVPGLGLGGKLDRIVDFGSQPKIADLKTGASLDYSWGTIAVQLACYANAATLYDAKTKKHTPMPDVDKVTALVIHLPAGQARCDLYWVDIEAGWEAAQHAKWVRDWRKRKNLADPWREDVAVDNVDVRRARLLQRAQDVAALAGGRQRLAAAWPKDTPTFKQAPAHTADQLDLIALTLSNVEAAMGAAFGAPDPAA